MSLALPRYGLRKQPQIPVRIDWRHPLAAGLVEYWLFNSRNTAAIDLVSGARLTYTGGASPAVAIDGACFTFDGVGDYLSETRSVITGLLNFTMAAHFQLNATAQVDKRFFSHGSSASNNPIASLGTGNPSAAKVNLFARDAATANATINSAAAQDTNPHVAVGTFDLDGTSRLFCDGIQEGSVDTSGLGASTFDRTAVGALLRAAVASDCNCKVYAAANYKRTLSQVDGRELSRNIYAMLVPSRPMAYFGQAAVGGGTTVARLVNGGLVHGGTLLGGRLARMAA